MTSNIVRDSYAVYHTIMTLKWCVTLISILYLTLHGFFRFLNFYNETLKMKLSFCCFGWNSSKWLRCMHSVYSTFRNLGKKLLTGDDSDIIMWPNMDRRTYTTAFIIKLIYALSVLFWLYLFQVKLVSTMLLLEPRYLPDDYFWPKLLVHAGVLL